MEYRNNFVKTWSILLGISATLFFVVAIAMIAFDTKYLQGAQYLATAVLFFSSLVLMIWKNADVKNKTLFNTGFIFAVVGLTTFIGPIMLGLWAAGVVFFIVGLVGKE